MQLSSNVSYVPLVASVVVPETRTSAPCSPSCVMADTLNLYVVSGVSWETVTVLVDVVTSPFSSNITNVC